MELRLIQREVGRFNLLGSEKSLSFSMGLYEDNKIIKEGNRTAKIYYFGEPEEEDYFADPFNDLETIFEKCYEYSNKVISSTDYAGDCLLFAKLYSANYESINAQLLEKHKERTTNKIAKLERELKWDEIVPEITHTVNGCIEKEIKKYRKWIESSEKELSELKEESEKYQKTSLKIQAYRDSVLALERQKLVPDETH